jgi:serine/threonine-protein kinase HipA
LGHFDFNRAGAYGYEQAIQLAEELGTTPDERRQLYRRMVFNVVARNQDDHTKNIAFLMDRSGQWRLSPAFDVTFSYNPDGQWTSQHQMTVNGKQDGLTLDDLLAVAKRFKVIGVRRGKSILAEIVSAVERWSEFAEIAEVQASWQAEIAGHHRRF